MKLTKIVGAFALTAALAMGTVPAFASGATLEVGNDGVFTDAGNDADGNPQAKASTTIKGTTINSQIQATVPISLTVVVPSDGQGPILTPSPDKYVIKNLSDENPFDVVEAIAANGQFQIVEDCSEATYKDKMAMTLTINPAGTEINLATGMAADLDNLRFTVGPSSEAALNLAGTIADHKDQPLSASNLQSTFATINYTIAGTKAA